MYEIGDVRFRTTGSSFSEVVRKSKSALLDPSDDHVGYRFEDIIAGKYARAWRRRLMLFAPYPRILLGEVNDTFRSM